MLDTEAELENFEQRGYFRNGQGATRPKMLESVMSTNILNIICFPRGGLNFLALALDQSLLRQSLPLALIRFSDVTSLVLLKTSPMSTTE